MNQKNIKGNHKHTLSAQTYISNGLHHKILTKNNFGKIIICARNVGIRPCSTRFFQLSCNLCCVAQKLRNRLWQSKRSSLLCWKIQIRWPISWLFSCSRPTFGKKVLIWLWLWNRPCQHSTLHPAAIFYSNITT